MAIVLTYIQFSIYIIHDIQAKNVITYLKPLEENSRSCACLRIYCGKDWGGCAPADTSASRWTTVLNNQLRQQYLSKVYVNRICEKHMLTVFVSEPFWSWTLDNDQHQEYLSLSFVGSTCRWSTVLNNDQHQQHLLSAFASHLILNWLNLWH